MRTPPFLTAALAAAAGIGLLAAAVPARAADVTISVPSCTSWSLAGNTLTCNTAAPPPTGNGTAPYNCSANVTPSALTAAGNVAVTASCSGDPVTGWRWSANSGFMANSTASAGSGTVQGSTTFTVTATNAAGSSSAFGNVTLNTSTGGGNGGGNTAGGISCTGFAQTTVMPLAWPASSTTIRGLSQPKGGFGANGALVVQFTTSSSGGFGRISSAEYGSAPTGKTAVLSTTPCDFGPQPLPGATQVGVSITVNYSVGANGTGYYPELLPNTTYYLNIKNEKDGAQTCFGSCDVAVDLKAP